MNQANLDAFFADCTAFAAWSAAGATADTAPLGAGTAAALAAIKAIRAKADDFFARCRLATFDARALAALNRSESEFLAIAAKDLTITTAEISALPLARIEAGRAFPLTEGVNPAWAAAAAALHTAAVTPVFGPGKHSLTAAEWSALNARLTASASATSPSSSPPTKRGPPPRPVPASRPSVSTA